MKIKLKQPNLTPENLVCRGRGIPKSKAGLAVCYRIKSEGEGSRKTHITELVSTKTGRSIGYIGHDENRNCAIVADPQLAIRKDYLNKFQNGWLLRDCLLGFGTGDSKKFNAALKKALKNTLKESK